MFIYLFMNKGSLDRKSIVIDFIYTQEAYVLD